MKLIKLLAAAAVLLAALGLSSGLAAAAEAAITPLCLPGGQDELSTDCQMAGPAAYLRNQALAGIILPRSPLAAAELPAEFSPLPYNYVRLNGQETPIYGSLEDALSGQNAYRSIPAGLGYVTYVDYYQGGGSSRHYMIEPGMWVRGGSTSGRAVLSEFRGLLFNGTPQRQFGWVIYPTESQVYPGATDPVYTGRSLARYEIIQVYQSMEMEGTTWLMIGPDEWIDKVKTALVYPAEAPPDGVANGRWIEINLLEQTLSVYQDNRLIFATLVSTGIPGWWTRPGLFQITEKLDSTPMSGSFEADRSDYYYLEDVPWTMYFDQARALHGAYWHDYFGYEQSHGCVNLSPGDSHWLYLWAGLGDYVYVWDPSGQTPTDPALYTPGGA